MPTAVHAVADAHDTPDREVYELPVGLGVGWIAQPVPFHRSANASVPELLVKYPTAVHAVADVHDTPASWLLLAPAGLGEVWIAQLEPFHCSVNVSCVPALSVKYPMAVHTVIDVHDTPVSWLFIAPAGLGMVWIDQAVPSQCSANVT
jgi:hypothetical protein